MTTATKPKKKRARQMVVKELEGLRDEVLDDLIEDREEQASKVSSARTKLGDINAAIRERMEEKELKVYEHGSYRLSVEEGEPELKIVKIKEKKEEPANK